MQYTLINKNKSTSSRTFFTLLIGMITTIFLACDEPDPVPKLPPQYIRVTFNTNDGSAISRRTIVKNTTVKVPTKPTKNGATFVGWFTSDSNYTSSNKFNFDTPITRNTTLYAGWKYTITLNPNGGSFSTSASNTISLVGGRSITIPTNDIPSPVKGSAPFAGWFNAALLMNSDIGEKKITASTPITRDTTLHARWGYTLTFIFNNDTPPQTKFVPADNKNNVTISDSDMPTEPTKSDGSSFEGWFTSGTYKTKFDINDPITGNTTLYAGWAYTVTFNSDPELIRIYKSGIYSTPELTVTYDKIWKTQVIGGKKVTPKSEEVKKFIDNKKATAHGSDIYKIDTWYTQSYLGYYYKFDFSTPVNEDITLYPGWKLTVNRSSVNEKEYMQKNITALELSSAVTTIGKYAFANNRIASVSFSEGLTKIDKEAFDRNKLESLRFPKSLKRIEAFAFSHNWLTDVTFPEDAEIQYIGDTAFYGRALYDSLPYNRIRNLTLPTNNKLTYIGERAFAYNALAEVTIPPGIDDQSKIANGAFYNNYRSGVVRDIISGNRENADVPSLTKVSLTTTLYKSLQQEKTQLVTKTTDWRFGAKDRLDLIFGATTATTLIRGFSTTDDDHVTYTCDFSCE